MNFARKKFILLSSIIISFIIVLFLTFIFAEYLSRKNAPQKMSEIIDRDVKTRREIWERKKVTREFKF